MTRSLCLVSAILMLIVSIPSQTEAGVTRDRALAEILEGLPSERIETGILYDRVISLSRIENHDGGLKSKPVTLRQWRQIYHEIYRASLSEPSWPDLETILESAQTHIGRGVVPIAVMSFRFNRIRSDALESGALMMQDGRLVLGEGEPFVEEQVFAVAPLKDRTWRADVVFRLDRRLYLTNDSVMPERIDVDFDDGRGFVTLDFDHEYPVHYSSPGPKTLRIRLLREGCTTLYARSAYNVEALQTPSPDDTLQITASIPYLGQFGTGEGYVYLSDMHEMLTDPVVVVEGFDLDNSMNWDELYALLNREELLETLRNMGYDAVVLNFTDATDYVQRNAFVLVELIEQINALIEPGTDLAVVGASMGGIVSRYAMAYMETNGLSPNARTFISFDSPQDGADIPLGIQYWLAFFADLSDAAAGLLATLDSPAARQLLVYHHTDPPGPTGESDPLREELLIDLEAIGQYPALIRKAAIANGSGSQIDQGFSAGDQIIQWEYRSLLVDITGNIWAVPDGTSQVIFHGLIDFIILPADEQYVTVGGTLPYDNAPGGSRASMAEMAATEAPYGDIIALHDSHSFIPTVSALALDTQDLFYDVAGDPDILSMTPFDAVYFPTENQEHVAITPENAQWIITEIQGGASYVPSHAAMGMPLLSMPYPNPMTAGTNIRFALPEGGRVRIAVFDPTGRRVAIAAQGDFAAGGHRASWNGTNVDGARLSSGVYFLNLTGEGFSASHKLLIR